MPRIAHVVLDTQAGYACTLRARGHALTADEARSHGGTDTGPTPYELLLSGLAACTAITLRMVGERKGWALGAIHVNIELHKDDTGADRIARTVSIAGALDPAQRAALAEIAEKTPVTKTIKAGAKIDTQFVQA
jgi:putative redox protein